MLSSHDITDARTIYPDLLKNCHWLSVLPQQLTEISEHGRMDFLWIVMGNLVGL